MLTLQILKIFVCGNLKKNSIYGKYGRCIEKIVNNLNVETLEIE